MSCCVLCELFGFSFGFGFNGFIVEFARCQINKGSVAILIKDGSTSIGMMQPAASGTLSCLSLNAACRLDICLFLPVNNAVAFDAFHGLPPFSAPATHDKTHNYCPQDDKKYDSQDYGDNAGYDFRNKFNKD